MRFLADESCDFFVVKCLREAGHDVLTVSEIAPRADDSEVINHAVSENRILLPEDKDFGNLVFAHGGETLGVIFLRFPFSCRIQIAQDVSKLVEKKGKELGSSDLGRVGNSYPTVNLWFKAAPDGVALHSDQMREAAGSEEGWKATVIAGKAVALSAYELLTHPEKVKAIQEQFNKIKGEDKK